MKTQLKESLGNLKFSLKHITKGSMKNTHMLNVTKNRTTKRYEPFTAEEMTKIIEVLMSKGFTYYNDEPFVNDSNNWKYFNGSMSVTFK